MDNSYSLFSLPNPLGILLVLYLSMSTSAAMAVPAFSPKSKAELKSVVDTCLYRKDGVRITHDPFAPGMIEKYGAPGKTDNEGFDPYADAVGPGIYGGIVKRDETGKIVIGRQYQNHNPHPGPVYAGGGYTKSTQALKSPEGFITNNVFWYCHVTASY